MTTTARTATRRIADDTVNLAALVIAAIFDDLEAEFETCAFGHPAAELFWRLDENNDEIQVCEHCADTRDLGYAAD